MGSTQDGSAYSTTGSSSTRKRRTADSLSLNTCFLPVRLRRPCTGTATRTSTSFILEGTVGALLGDEEVYGTAGVLIFKPRGQWHTFWNAGDTPARILEIISPGGFEQAFRDLDKLGGELTPEAVSVIGERYAVDIDFEGTGPLAERHGLSM